MTDETTTQEGPAHVEGPAPGWTLTDAEERPIGIVDAVFADYLLVRTRGFLPVDLYVPRTAVRPADRPATLVAEAADADEAYRSWHRPLKQAPHP
jgi:hypothetical protein